MAAPWIGLLLVLCTLDSAAAFSTFPTLLPRVSRRSAAKCATRMMAKPLVLIVGGGPAGLLCGQLLAERGGARVKILDAGLVYF